MKWGDGGLWHRVKARVVVFRPFVGEVLVGKVKSSDEGGIRGEFELMKSMDLKIESTAKRLMEGELMSRVLMTSI